VGVSQGNDENQAHTSAADSSQVADGVGGNAVADAGGSVSGAGWPKADYPPSL
ncbi:MAG: hypothetical protein RLZZ597_1508, partial [Cyanobacteriota bacterium]